MRLFPVVEHYPTLQGEGCWAGTPMLFIRLAGCPIGRYQNPGDRYSKCASAFGTEFTCDTDYRKGQMLDTIQLAAETDIPRVCITGGEPFAHPEVGRLILALQDIGRFVHVETSGTIPIRNAFLQNEATPDSQLAYDPSRLWVTCSPKRGFVPINCAYVDEWKVIVDPDFFTSVERVNAMTNIVGLGLDTPVFLQCIGTPTSAANGPSIDAAIKFLLEIRPSWRMSVQTHKYLGLS